MLYIVLLYVGEIGHIIRFLIALLLYIVVEEIGRIIGFLLALLLYIEVEEIGRNRTHYWFSVVYCCILKWKK